MRAPGVVVSLFAWLLLGGCTSSGIDALELRPSAEITSSIGAPDKVQVSGGVDVADASLIEETADPGPMPEADVGAGVEPSALVAPARPARQAMLAPSKPQVRPLSPQGEQVYRRRFRDAKPINFGKASPKQLAVHGVDVSRWQGRIDWENLRSQGANFAYIKATDGGDHLDPMFRANWRGAAQAGLRRGAYHFFYWCRTAGEQADWFIRNVPKVEGALPPVIDVEWNGESSCKRRPGRAKVLEKMQVFMDKLEAHYGQRPIIYTAPDFYRDNLTGAFLDYPFWLRSVAAHPSKRYPGRKWVFWQYSGSGLSHGVRGRIDLNVFHGSEAEWRQWVAAN